MKENTLSLRKAMAILTVRRVTWSNFDVAAQQGKPSPRLERCDGKLSRTVLRWLGAGNSSRLPDYHTNLIWYE